MAPTQDTAPLSDTETAERPVREQLKKASLAGIPGDSKVEGAQGEETAEGQSGSGGVTESRGRLQRKRSYEEVQEGDEEQPRDVVIGSRGGDAVRNHRRKRSRDSTAEEQELNDGRKVSGERPRDDAEIVDAVSGTNGDKKEATTKRPGTPDLERQPEATVEAMASPKTKRSRLHSTTADENGTLATESSKPEVPIEKDAASAEAVPAPSEGTTKIPPTSGFANTSAVSPFGALAGSKSPTTTQKETSPSAFAASGFSSLAGKATSGFGAIGKDSGGFGAGGGFGTGGKSPLASEPGKENEKPKESSSSAFGGALGQKSAFSAAPAVSSCFGSGASRFGKLGASSGSGFGGNLGSNSPFGAAAGGGLSSFASGKPSSSLASNSKAAKPFGAPADEEDETEDTTEDDNAGYKSPPLSQEEDKQDERFYEQQLETGEEEEETAYSCRAKLYNYATLEDGKKEWRERGLGMLRLNVKRDDDGKPKARFLMRADGSHRVVLNTPVKKEIKFGAAAGGPPQGGLMLFMGTIDGKTSLEMLQLKIRQQFALELYDKIVELQEEM